MKCRVWLESDSSVLPPKSGCFTGPAGGLFNKIMRTRVDGVKRQGVLMGWFLPPFQGSIILDRYLGFRRSGSTLGYIPAAASRLPILCFLTVARPMGLKAPFLAALALCLIAATPSPAQPTLVIDTPMSPPSWALMERALLDANSQAVEAFAEKYIDERGYLLHTPRWGTLDGPDDAIETYYNWTLLHALGGSDSVLRLYKKGLEGHLLQYNELRTELTELASNGAYHKEFITMSDWFHTGEGMRAFFPAGVVGSDRPADGRPHAALRSDVYGRRSRSAQLRPGQENHQEYLERQPRPR